jgi:predicted esterase
MITFLPSSDFAEVARMLDDKRLGGQRTEAWAILKWLRDPAHYPKLVKAGYCAMWSGFEDALVTYVNAMLVEWARRGKKNDQLRPYDASLGLVEVARPQMPPWLGCEDLHGYHRAALLAKLPEHYSQFGWRERGSTYNGSYPWPVKDAATGGWVLRWPKYLKRPSTPILTAPGADSPPTQPPEPQTRPEARKRKRATSEPDTKPGPLFGTELSAEEQAARPMSKVLFFGRKQSPRALVVMIHGLCDTADGWHGSFAGRWARGLPGVLVAVPQSPDECGAHSPHQPGWSTRGDRKYDWLSQTGRDVDASDWPACVRTLQAVTAARIRQFDGWLDVLLAAHGLTDRQLVLVGFSQGAILAAISGIRRRCRGVVAVGGVPGQPIYDAGADDYVGGGWMDWERMVDAGGAAATTRVCLINGTKDGYVSRAKNEALFAPFADVMWHWDKGKGHDFPEAWYGTALEWLKETLAENK